MTNGLANQILSVEDLQALDAAERILNDIQPVIDKAEACGIECQQERKLSQFLSNKLTGIKQEFSPTVRRNN